LYECLDEVLPAITQVINNSLSTGIFPESFKTALVKPLLKKPTLDPNVLKNFRPVSNLTFLSKILEKIVLAQTLKHVNSNSLFSVFQSAYRPHRSTETALLKIFNDLLCALDERKITVLALLDLSSAFDTIDHEILLCRLQSVFGIEGTVLAWFSSYLTERSQTVSVDGCRSEPSPLRFGVPQGSVLGPVLFLLYVQPLSDLISSRSISHHAFADDTQMYNSDTVERAANAVQSISQCIDHVKSWMTTNKLMLNDGKTEAMLVANPRISSSLPLPSSLSVDGTLIGFSASVRNLGVTLDSGLSMSQHVRAVCRSSYLELRRISSVRHLLTVEATKTLVCAFVLSKLDYCNSLLCGCPQYLIDRLQKIQNNAARLVVRVRKTDHVTPILKSLHWLPVSSRIQYKVMSICFNCLSGTSPEYLSSLLHVYTPSRELRSSSDKRKLCIPSVQTKTFGQRTFVYQAPVLWNTLPLEVRNSESVSDFKRSLKTHLFKLYFE
jgi:hypothetical protein